jgi:pyruvate kinase
MLESMVVNARPTRAEASDVANAVLDGSDAVMLSAETAAGAFPVEAVTTMEHIVTLIEEHSDERWDLKRRKPDVVYPPPLAVGYSVCHAAELVGARAIVCLTRSGGTARTIARFRPSQPVIAVTSSPQTHRRLSFIWGVTPLLLPYFRGNVDDAVDEILRRLRDMPAVDIGDRVVITAGLPFSSHSETNMLRIEEV